MASPNQVLLLGQRVELGMRHVSTHARCAEWIQRLCLGRGRISKLLTLEKAVGSDRVDRKGAEEAYLKSLELWEKAGWPYYQAKALVSYSQATVETNPDESKRRLDQAAEIFRKLGAKRDLEKAEAKLSAKA